MIKMIESRELISDEGGVKVYRLKLTPEARAGLSVGPEAAAAFLAAYRRLPPEPNWLRRAWRRLTRTKAQP